MLWVILALLVLIWLVGTFTSHTMGGLIHGLPVVALVLLAVRIGSGMVEVLPAVAGETGANNESLVVGR